MLVGILYFIIWALSINGVRIGIKDLLGQINLRDMKMDDLQMFIFLMQVIFGPAFILYNVCPWLFYHIW